MHGRGRACPVPESTRTVAIRDRRHVGKPGDREGRPYGTNDGTCMVGDGLVPSRSRRGQSRSVTGGTSGNRATARVAPTGRTTGHASYGTGLSRPGVDADSRDVGKPGDRRGRPHVGKPGDRKGRPYGTNDGTCMVGDGLVPSRSRRGLSIRDRRHVGKPGDREGRPYGTNDGTRLVGDGLVPSRSRRGLSIRDRRHVGKPGDREGRPCGTNDGTRIVGDGLVPSRSQRARRGPGAAGRHESGRPQGSPLRNRVPEYACIR